MLFDTYSEVLNGTIDGLKKGDMQKLFGLVEETRSNGEHPFVLGSSGSAAATSHWICDFGKGINRRDSRHLKIFSPADDGAIFSTLGNDYRYETAFVEQMKNFLEPGDLVLTFSVSGNSSNFVGAHRHAEEIGAKTACVVADRGGKIVGMSDFAMITPSENYGIVEDIHVILGHAISQRIYADNVGA